MKQLTIAQRLGLGFGLILSLMIIITLIGINRVGVIDNTLTEVSDNATVKQRYAINFRGSVHDRAIAIRDLVLAPTPQAVSQQLQLIDKLDGFYQESASAMDALFAATAPGADEQRLLAAIKDIEREGLALTGQLIELRQAGQIDAAQQLLITEVSPAYTQWLARVNAFIDYEEQVIGEQIGTVRDVAGGFQWLILAFTGIAVLLGALISVLIIRQIRSPWAPSRMRWLRSFAAWPTAS